MTHEGAITVTFGNTTRKFRMGTTRGQVLKHMSQQFPPRGALLHVGDESLVVTSQEEILSEKEYIYEHPNPNASSKNRDGVDPKLLNAVLRLQLAKGGQLVTYGTVVVFNREGMCLTALHCLEAAGITARSQSLRVGGHVAKIIAVDVGMDIACLAITDGDGSDFDFIPLDYTMVHTMKIHLISYPAMVDEFKNLMPTITHGQVANILNTFQCLGDYACFPNSSGGAIVSNNRLVGIHLEVNYFENKSRKNKGTMSNAEMFGWLESNQAHKSSLGVFVFSSSIGAFLVKHKVIAEGRVQAPSSHSGFPVMVSKRQTRK